MRLAWWRRGKEDDEDLPLSAIVDHRLRTVRSEDLDILNAFLRYSDDGDKKWIRRYGLREINQAIRKYAAESRLSEPHFVALVERRNQLRERWTAPKRWLERAVFIALGAAATVVASRWLA